MRKKRKIQFLYRKIYAGLLLAATLLLSVGCSNNMQEEEENTFPDEKYPINFSMGKLAMTRGTVDNTWEGGESIAIEVGGEVKEYVVAKDGSLAPAKDVTPFLWTGPTMEVSAWCYPQTYTYDRPSAMGINTDQTTGAGHQSGDLLATTQTITFNHSAPCLLTFKHLPVKVVINLKAGKDMTEEEIKSTTVTILNHGARSERINTDWSVEQKTDFVNSHEFLPNVRATPNPGYLKTLHAILIPQKTTGRFLEITRGNMTYRYSASIDFKSGKKYTYNVTINKESFDITVSNSEDWVAGSTGDATSTEGYDIYDANDLKIGDYYYHDGSHSDGGLRIYTSNQNNENNVWDNVFPVLTNPDTKQPRSVIGIVYWLGDIRKVNYGLLDSKFPNGTTGLVVSLWDLRNPQDESKKEMKGWIMKASQMDNLIKDWDEMPEGFSWNNHGAGYAHTQALKWYHTLPDLGDKEMPSILALANFERSHPAPMISSGWYWPDSTELENMCWGQNVQVVNSQGTYGRDILNLQLGKVTGEPDLLPTVAPADYWASDSSDMAQYYQDFAIGIGGGHGWYEPGYLTALSFVRPILAF